MAEQPGKLQSFSVPVAATPTTFTFEISSDLTITSTLSSAVNKAADRYLTKTFNNTEWSVGCTAHLDASANPALDVVRDAATEGTELLACELDTGATGWLATGDCLIDNFTVSGPTEGMIVVGFNAAGNGAVVWS